MTEGVSLFTVPWVTGTRAQAYYGSVEGRVFVPDWALGRNLGDAYAAAEELAHQRLRRAAREAGDANAIVALETTWELAADDGGTPGLRVTAIGTAARLVGVGG